MLNLASTSIDNYFLSQGVLGVTVLVLAAVIIYLYKSYDKKLTDKQSQVDMIQEERLKNALETRDKLTEPIEEMTRTIKNIYDAVLRNRN
jgi:predicted P-loop ATPase/GTPase